MGTVGSDPGRQNNFAESEIKFWLSMDRKYIDFIWEI